MPYSVVLALLSLVCAGINDVVFKSYSGKDRSLGIYVFGIGVVWTGLQAAAFKVRGQPFSDDAATVGFGALAGLLLTGSNILLLESLRRIQVSL